MHEAKLSVWSVLRGAGGTVRRAGVGRRAGLLLVLGRAVRLQGRQCRRGVPALGRAAFAAEQLAFDFPEVVAIVKSERGQQEEGNVQSELHTCVAFWVLSLVCTSHSDCEDHKTAKTKGCHSSPQLLSGFDVLTGEEGDVWETKVLVFREHSASKQVGLAHVVEEAADVSIETGIDAVEILWLAKGGER